MGSLLKKAVLLLGIPVLVVVAYDAPIFYSRWRSTRDEQTAARAKEADEARHTLAMLGGGELKILQFYGPAAIRKGEDALICYGVNGAKSVRMEPSVGELQPALSHCLEVSPRVTTQYKLIAGDGSGHTTTQQITIRVEH